MPKAEDVDVPLLRTETGSRLDGVDVERGEAGQLLTLT
jgi:hypothetical protein